MPFDGRSISGGGDRDAEVARGGGGGPCDGKAVIQEGGAFTKRLHF